MIFSHFENFKETDCISTYFSFNPHAIRPNESEKWEKNEPSKPIRFFLSNKKSHSFNQSWSVISVFKILVGISSVHTFEPIPFIIKILSTEIVCKSVVDHIMDKYNSCHCSDIINVSRFVTSTFWVKLLWISVSDYFLSCSVVLSFSTTISIRYCSCMMSCFIMITLNTEEKMSWNVLDSMILISKFASMFNFA